MSINALLVSTLKNQMWHNFKPFWRASVKEQSQVVFNNTLKKDVYCQQRTGRISSVTTERCNKNEPKKARRVSEINRRSNGYSGRPTSVWLCRSWTRTHSGSNLCYQSWTCRRKPILLSASWWNQGKRSQKRVKLWHRMTNWLCQMKYPWKILQKVSTSWASFFIRIRKAMKTLLYTCDEVFACSAILAPGRSLKLRVTKLHSTSSVSKTIKAFNLPFLRQLQKFWLPINGSYFVLFFGFFWGEVTSHSSMKKIGNPKSDLKKQSENFRHIFSNIQSVIK